MDANILILYILFPLSVLAGLKIRKFPKEELISRQESSFLRGISSLMVIFAHYCLRLEEEGRLTLYVYPFRLLGPLGVAIFFFVSGYGLYASHRLDALNKQFLTKRLAKVYVPYIIVRIIRLPFSNDLGIEINNIFELLEYILGITFSPAWFVVVIMIFYFLYYFISKLKYDDKRKILTLFVATFILSLVLYIIFGEEETNWYGNNFLFPLGILFGFCKTGILKLIKKRYLVMVLVNVSALLLTGVLYFKLGSIWQLVDKMFAGIFLVTFFILITQKLDIRSPFMIFLGKYSLYLYLIHTSVYRIMRTNFDMKNPIFTTLYFAVTIGVAILLKKIIDLLIRPGNFYFVKHQS